MSVIAITGVGGTIGRRLVAELEDDPDVTRIVGIDQRVPSGLTSSKLQFRVGDIREPDIAGALAGCDVLVHLAFRLDPIHDEPALRAVNVDGTTSVFRAAATAGIRHVVYPSSVLVYGAHPDNDVPLTESSQLRGVPAFPYAQHKREVEDWLSDWAAANAQLDLTVLRFGALLGPEVDNFITRSLEAPRIPTIRGHRPPLQFLHPDDAVSAVVHVVQHRLAGVFNVCADGWLSFDEVTAIIGRGTVEVPEELAYSSVERMWSIGMGGLPPGVLALFMHPWVMTAEKLQATGWRPRHSNRDAVASMALEHAGYLTLGPVRLRRSTLRRTAASFAGALVAALLLRRRRRPAS